MFGHRTSDFTSVSLNIVHASQTICKRSAANVLIFTGKRAMLILFYTGFATRCSVVFARQKMQCNFYTAMAIFTKPEKVCCALQKSHCFDYFRPHLGAVFFLHWNCKKKKCKTERMFWVRGWRRDSDMMYLVVWLIVDGVMRFVYGPLSSCLWKFVRCLQGKIKVLWGCPLWPSFFSLHSDFWQTHHCLRGLLLLPNLVTLRLSVVCVPIAVHSDRVPFRVLKRISIGGAERAVPTVTAFFARASSQCWREATRFHRVEWNSSLSVFARVRLSVESIDIRDPRHCMTELALHFPVSLFSLRSWARASVGGTSNCSSYSGNLCVRSTTLVGGLVLTSAHISNTSRNLAETCLVRRRSLGQKDACSTIELNRCVDERNHCVSCLRIVWC